MEANISIWRKTGHFYFALTRAARRLEGHSILTGGLKFGRGEILLLWAWSGANVQRNLQQPPATEIIPASRIWSSQR